MKKRLIVTSALSGFWAFTCSALAADPIDMVYDWSGPYIGVQGGYGMVDASQFNDLYR